MLYNKGESNENDLPVVPNPCPMESPKIYKQKTNVCWRCNTEIGTMYHIWWGVRR